MPSNSVKPRSFRPPRPSRFLSGENAGLLPRRDGSYHNPEDWDGPDVSLPPIPNHLPNNPERFSQPVAGHDSAPRSPRRMQEKGIGNEKAFRHRGKLLKKSSNESFENKIISFNMSKEFSCEDLSCSVEFHPVSKQAGDRGVFDTREQTANIRQRINPPSRRKLPPNRHRTSDSGREHFGSVHVDSESTDPVSLSGICNVWKDHAFDERSGVSASPCKSNLTAQTESTWQSDTRSWASSDLEIDLEDDDSLSCDNSTSRSRQIELQEEALIALAMERSMADLSFEVEAHSSVSSLEHRSRSSSTNHSTPKPRCQPIRRHGLRPTTSQLGGAGCHLSMIANGIKSQKKKQSSRSDLAPMLGLKRADSSEEFQLLEPAKVKRGNSSDDFVWERDPETNRWFKRPMSKQSGKSEDDCILEKVAELSIRDALKNSLGELQEVAQIRSTNHW